MIFVLNNSGLKHFIVEIITKYIIVRTIKAFTIEDRRLYVFKIFFNGKEGRKKQVDIKSQCMSVHA